MGFLGGLEKMKIQAFKDAEFNEPAGEVSVFINPEKYSHSYKICWNAAQAQGSSGYSPKFNKMGAEKVEFELVFDGTGVVPGKIPGASVFTEDGITKQVAAFKDLVFTYHGGIHSPNFLKIVWGKFLFQCRLETLNFTYTLFKPDGTPLRARANAAFVEFNTEKQLAQKSKTSSPDLSHVLTVEAGDLLPLMCFRIYGSSAHYVEVARVNGLSDFRNLAVGTQLLFPPLGEAAL